MKTIQNTPKLRFKEFSEEWETLTFGTATTINPKSQKLPNSFIYIDLESVSKGILSKEERINLDEAPSRAQRLLVKKDILYQTVRPYQKNNFYFDKVDTDYVASTGYAQIRTENSSQFIFQYLHSAFFVNKVLLRCTGTSYPAINSTDLSKIKINLPNKIEQQKIANFLTAVDSKINQLQKKKSLLQDYKKGIMQQIFSQKLRFKDTNGKSYPNWEEKFLGEVFKISAGGDIKKENVSKVKTDTFVYPIYANSEKKKGLYGFSDIYKIDCKCITITGRGSLGKANARFNRFYPIVRLLVLKPKFKLNVLFFESAINQLRIISESTGVPQLTAPQISNYKVSFPCKEEQTQIANFLSAIDTKIELANTQIENTKIFKKGLLQQLFV